MIWYGVPRDKGRAAERGTLGEGLKAGGGVIKHYVCQRWYCKISTQHDVVSIAPPR